MYLLLNKVISREMTLIFVFVPMSIFDQIYYIVQHILDIDILLFIILITSALLDDPTVRTKPRLLLWDTEHTPYTHTHKIPMS